jgi:uncharacterized membrane protein
VTSGRPVRRFRPLQPTAWSPVGPRQRAGRGLALPLAALTVAAQIGYPLLHGAARNRLTVLVVLLFAATSLAHAAASRGPRVAALVLLVFGAGGLLVEAVGTGTGWPFGRYAYAGTLGAEVLGVPLLVPLGWLMLGWPAYLVGTWLTAPAGPAARRRAAAARVVVAGWALASWDLFLDPQMVAAGHWRWSGRGPALPGVPAVPLTDYAGWLLVSLILMAVLDVLVRARPGPADRLAHGLYLWTYLSSVLGHAAFLGLPWSALWGGLGMGAVAVPLALSLRAPAPAGRP